MADQEVSLAILFADICGSTQLYETSGDVRAHRLVTACIDQLARITAQNGGTVVKTIGDEILATFPSADSAFAAAMEMQEAERAERLSIKSGFHFGPVVQDAGDIFGDAVNVAARLTKLAHAGEVLMTEDVVQLLSAPFRRHARLIDKTTVKGKRDPLNIYSAVTFDSEMTALGTVRSHTTMAPPGLVLTYSSREFYISPREPRFVVGRSEESDLVVPDAQVSRQHATIEMRRGIFHLIDTSTNGTYVVTNNDDVVFLKRESMQLLGSGTISLGREPASNPDGLLHFRRGGGD